jgi:protein SCO1/2
MFKRFIFTFIFGLVVTGVTWYFLNPMLTIKPDHAQAGVSGSTLLVGTELTPHKDMIAFNLQSSENRNFNQESLLGHWTLIFFGYTECPEICPKTLGIMSNVWPQLTKQKPTTPLQFLFVSLDPQSDTPQSLKNFLGKFNPSFVGLTGDTNEVTRLKEHCRIYSYLDPKLNPQGKKMIDHSATILLINPQGKIQALFSPPHEAQSMIQDLNTLIN